MDAPKKVKYIQKQLFESKLEKQPFKEEKLEEKQEQV